MPASRRSRRELLQCLRRCRAPNTVTSTGPAGGFVAELAERGERRLQARDADGEAGRRHRLAHEARDEPIVTPAAADRAEAHRAAFVVFGFDQQFNFVDGAGVVLEAADDGWIDANSVACHIRLIRLADDL